MVTQALKTLKFLTAVKFKKFVKSKFNLNIIPCTQKVILMTILIPQKRVKTQHRLSLSFESQTFFIKKLFFKKSKVCALKKFTCMNAERRKKKKNSFLFFLMSNVVVVVIHCKIPTKVKRSKFCTLFSCIVMHIRYCNAMKGEQKNLKYTKNFSLFFVFE